MITSQLAQAYPFPSGKREKMEKQLSAGDGIVAGVMRCKPRAGGGDGVFKSEVGDKVAERIGGQVRRDTARKGECVNPRSE